MPLEEIRAALPADTALVEYFRIQERTVACVLTRDDSHRSCDGGTRIQKLLQLLQLQMSKFRLHPNYIGLSSACASTEAHLKSLYQELLAPIRRF